MGGRSLRITAALRDVLAVFMLDPEAEYYGLELARGADLPSGTLYPLLARLEGRGLVESRNEDPEIYLGTGRPPRRYYRLTRDGAALAAEALTPRRAGRRVSPRPGT
ncbi:PadR family transcriptional regulator [Actinomycetospora termitidis]|uniref:Helix-turn-helix transcriptional regulator n=1 Tax=Actinomycetospora termitidis TaxID=3053470 RepID=A0ABT7M1B5_9PSEU|nr:helix-turn-helix transcriptional regulator [Actinomycetospora sp. Odt1-22]MDL5154435.1 helix-turn-helix transcriptional regulator [Actinomycetospora sp. Odt1-22]